jgi:hypothetical protein
MELDQETAFFFFFHDHSERISYTQVMWQENDAQIFREILVRELIIHSQEGNVTVSLHGADQAQLCPNSVDWK